MNPPLPDNNPTDNQQIIDKIDDFIKGLDTPVGTTIATAVVTKTAAASATPDPVLVVEPPKTEEEMRDFVLKHSAELVENSVRSILELQKLTVSTGDPEMMNSLASLIAASTGAIETVNKIQLQNQKVKSAIELKKLEIEGKKEIQKIKNDGNALLPAGQTNILFATREELMAQLTGKAKAIPVEVYEVSTVTLSSAP